MELWIKLSWLGVAAVNFMPSLVVFAPAMTQKLYGVDPTGDIGVLLVHRSIMFLTIVVLSIYAVFEPEARRVASIVAALSMVGFLLVYLRAGTPAGPLQSIALADLVGMVPLAVVVFFAWWPQAPQTS